MIRSRDETIDNIINAVDSMGKADAIGISCGGPLDSKRGIIMSPPNLPEWDDVHIVDMLTERFGIPAYLCNDANACALADRAAEMGTCPTPDSGRQEYLEGVVNRVMFG